MSDARSDVLGRVRAALPRALLPSVQEPRFGHAAPSRDLAALIDGFSREAAAVGCSVHGPAEPNEASDRLLAIVEETKAHELLAWSAGDLPLPGVRGRLIERGCRLLAAELGADPKGRQARLHTLAACGVGITGALAGIADTGTLVLASGPGRPRLAWLLPPVHVALLPVSRLQPDLPSFLARARETTLASANVSFVTGPSRTGDIELILTRGVHGPGIVHVLLLS